MSFPQGGLPESLLWGNSAIWWSLSNLWAQPSLDQPVSLFNRRTFSRTLLKCRCCTRWLDDFKDVGYEEDSDSITCALIVTAQKLGIINPEACKQFLVEGAATKCCGAAESTPSKGTRFDCSFDCMKTFSPGSAAYRLHADLWSILILKQLLRWE
jgi:hypothetical protein